MRKLHSTFHSVKYFLWADLDRRDHRLHGGVDRAPMPNSTPWPNRSHRIWQAAAESRGPDAWTEPCLRSLATGPRAVAVGMVKSPSKFAWTAFDVPVQDTITEGADPNGTRERRQPSLQTTGARCWNADPTRPGARTRPVPGRPARPEDVVADGPGRLPVRVGGVAARASPRHHRGRLRLKRPVPPRRDRSTTRGDIPPPPQVFDDHSAQSRRPRHRTRHGCPRPVRPADRPGNTTRWSPRAFA